MNADHSPLPSGAGERPQAAPRAHRARRIWLGVLVLLVSAAAVGYARLEDPAAFWNGVVLATARIAVPGLDRRNEEYLVFLKEDTVSVRQQIFAASSKATYVTDSLLPRVIVMRVSGDPEPVIAALRATGAVKLVTQYNPAFGCH